MIIYRVRCDACQKSDERRSDDESFNVQHGCYTNPAFIWWPVRPPVMPEATR